MVLCADMFTGIIQAVGLVEQQANHRLRVASPLKSFKIGDSVAVEGVCLTVTAVEEKGPGCLLDFDVSEETLQRTTLGDLEGGDAVNLEPPARIGDPLGGHFVLGHIDATGKIAAKETRGASTVYEFSVPMRLKNYLVSKGSVAVDGISLTVMEVREHSFTVAVIPHTEKNTSLARKKVDDLVNIETDILAKHVERLVRGWREEPSDDLFQKKVLTWEELLREKKEGQS